MRSASPPVLLSAMFLCAVWADVGTHIPVDAVFGASAYGALTELKPLKLHGYLGEMVQVDAILLSRPVRTIVELNAWLGLSSAYLAPRMLQGGRLFAIDSWDPEGNEYVQSMLPHYLPNTYDQFLSNMVRLNLTDIVIPVMDNVDRAASYVPQLEGYSPPDFVYVNSNPWTKSIRAEILSWYPLLSSGGIMCGNGVQQYETRQSAIDAAAELGAAVAKVSGELWCLVDPSKLAPGTQVTQVAGTYYQMW